MSILFDNPLPAIGCGDPGDPIAFALETSATSGLRRLTASAIPASEKTLWSVSFWGKSPFPAAQVFLGAGTTTSSGEQLKTTEDGYTRYYNAANILAEAQGMRRDPSNHAHYLWIFDTDNVVTSDRIRLFVNGQRVPVSGALTSGYNSYLNRAGVYQYVGCAGYSNGSIAAGGGILSDAILIGGRACAPEEFGYTNAYGHFVPRQFKGQGQGPNAYGATGWHLTFSDPLNLGLDVSGNGNHFTSIGLTTQSQVTDTPSNNTSTLNPLALRRTGGAVIDKNLTIKGANNPTQTISTFYIPPYSGRWYFEGQVQNYRTADIGLYRLRHPNYEPGQEHSYQWTASKVGTSGSPQAYGSTWAAGDIIGVKVDTDQGTVEFFRNGISQDIAFDDIAGVSWAAEAGDPSTTGVGYMNMRFKPETWTYVPEADYKPLTAANLPCPAVLNPDEYFTIRLSDSGTDVTDLPWDPTIHKTLCISKRRDHTTDWRISDSARGNNLAWASNIGGQETGCSLSFVNNGILVGEDNEYQGPRVDYFWRASTKAGFDIVILNHVSGTPSTIAHAAGGAIDWAWAVPRNGGKIFIHHSSLPTDEYVSFELENSGRSLAGWFSSTTNTVTLGASMPSGSYVLYLWREVPQFSRFSSRQGNGNADGVFSPLDFEPRIEFTKSTASDTYYYVRDSDRDALNPVTHDLRLDVSDVEADGRLADFLSNGVKVRSASAGINNSGTEYLCAHFARTPIKFARAR